MRWFLLVGTFYEGIAYLVDIDLFSMSQSPLFQTIVWNKLGHVLLKLQYSWSTKNIMILLNPLQAPDPEQQALQTQAAMAADIKTMAADIKLMKKTMEEQKDLLKGILDSLKDPKETTVQWVY